MSQDRIWDHFQNQDAESFADGYARQRALARMVQAGEQVLNIGVGAGDLERLAAARGAVVHVLDPNETSVEEIRQRLDLGERARSGYADRIPFDSGRFDVVLMTEVVEHLALEVLPAALGEVWRVLRAGGRLFVYGPFMRGGAHTAPSNAAFDQSLRAENAAWGVRDIVDAEREAGNPGRRTHCPRRSKWCRQIDPP